ncbi:MULTISPECIES: sigma-70 family RNA polymerase sigma factor [Pseudoalteromonas]|jgi:RNA polymerase sigma-70 factor (ECF subfamily)|uniref:Sigma-70 family RNA polymerase sigma factor n=3 Tax=Pseudoalteromonas TaxID=53246 RepID=A0AAD0U209_9GAMM|nr:MULTISPECIES: sigma-70 family RNA polymerase sigma factor [Pseudoalteromonas]MCP4061137.1 sigma-70 family RNA polymerase sigma factor [Pseudoalteromonas sp.]MDC9521809.1 sigma-70 family RNA polymerase sigma factor [Pseudoalteromonas sp. Angola-31]MDY6886897.1 sigma-70 family RNA polymerase sigma factor [Pseudomonadota bacterium]GEK76926.1 RNA polymerase sigma factor [Pseudoalteromonas atlantica]ATC84532.1 RNA polymerase sigma-70 factor, ECF subfamily [Pseudoalteromonas agarivorans DSM 14585|tara:strand:- start:693 stop:1217 length:525 start_codon:yes stop_codon:yes gene_type:complete
MENDNLLPLLCKTAQGNKAAFADLYQQTSAKLFAISLNMLSNRAHAEEVLQEAFIKIWHNASEYNSSKGTVISWMISIVRYRSLDALRYHKVRKEQAMGDDEYDEQAVDVSYDEQTKLVNCIEQLDPQQKQAIHLAYYKGLSHGELVNHIETPLGTVKSWIRRGLQQLQRCLTL